MSDVPSVVQKFEERGLDRKSFCLVPFTTIILEPDGSVGICRLKGTEFSVGNLAENSLEEIWNNEKVRNWRRAFLEGRKGPCAEEIENRGCNLCPRNNELLDGVEYSEHMPFPPIKLTANLNGKCNLECQMCHVWQLPNGRYTEENFWKPARKHWFSHLKEIDMLSGEPFLQSDTFKLINEVSALNPTCRYTFNTNAHWRLNKYIKDHLDKIDIKDLIISLDSLEDEIFAKIRKKGNLKVVLENIERIRDYSDERLKKGLNAIPLSLNFLVQKDNWHEVDDILQFCREKEIKPFVSFCYFPEEHSLLDLSERERLKILEFYFEGLESENIHHYTRVLKPLIRSLNNLDKAHFFVRMKELSEMPIPWRR